MFAQNFRHIVQSRRIKSIQISRDTGIPPNTISEYLTGKKTPSFERAVQIADYLNVSIDYLAGKTDTPTLTSIDSENDVIFAIYGANNDTTNKLYTELKRFVEFQLEREK